MASEQLFRILSIDGGGIRGIIPGLILALVEHYLIKATGNPDARLSDFFDLIAGTSTGGILACAFLLPNDSQRPKMTGNEVVDIYMTRGKDIFSIPVFHRLRSAGGFRDEKYPAKGLETALNDYFGETMLTDLLKPCLITSYDVTRREAHFFKQHQAQKRGDARNFKVKDACRATSAAPTYFECALVNSASQVAYPLVDGGIIVNNPTMCAYAEAVEAFGKKAAEMAILSIGTGFANTEYRYDDVKNWGLMHWPGPLIDMMMTGVSETVDYQLRQMFRATQKEKQYLRINTRLSVDINPDMDDTTDKNLNGLFRLGTETYQNMETQIKAFADEFLLP
jgi:patatin-like phospholipase/acyl hydrolase